MTVLCPRCGASFNPSLFTFGIRIRCDCGELVDTSHRVTANTQPQSRGGVVLHVQTTKNPHPELRERLKDVARHALMTEEHNIQEMGALADHVSFLIMSTDYPAVDIEAERRKARNRCEELFPDRVYLFDMIYGSRFRRLWEQFRAEPKMT
ncbi:MAG: hypothetical protein KJ970_12510 [Candidatus Eisenbacteria bacterium]|uniref:Uncharacterized protein n=1 Tax=Eiseniibacteriota bacterium TaxID=2212470 RepID=A0A948RVQ1_UNCEI|nr:hypothetical protein [Candidatus Eisenbacteria bacterium]MBU1950638.1 hypothetical protein [Candidatus Eisenbacteria bacterium]MBU2691740.1 hypothetical protein [Candidatus Eisenbacteria bacterium]